MFLFRNTHAQSLGYRQLRDAFHKCFIFSFFLDGTSIIFDFGKSSNLNILLNKKKRAKKNNEEHKIKHKWRQINIQKLCNFLLHIIFHLFIFPVSEQNHTNCWAFSTFSFFYLIYKIKMTTAIKIIMHN